MLGGLLAHPAHAAGQVLLRAPGADEAAAALELLGRFPGEAEKPWVLLSQVLLLTNEMAFVD